MNTESPNPPSNSQWTRGRILILGVIVALPAIVDLLTWPISKEATTAIAPVMLFLSLPLSLIAGLVAGLGMPGNRGLLLIWIPLFAALALATSLGLQLGSCALNEPRIHFQ